MKKQKKCQKTKTFTSFRHSKFLQELFFYKLYSFILLFIIYLLSLYKEYRIKNSIEIY